MESYIIIKEVRIDKKLSQSELARRVPMSQSYLSELESNKKSPTLRQICKIANALGVSPEELYYYL